MDKYKQEKLRLQKIEQAYKDFHQVLIAEVLKHYPVNQYTAEDIVQTTFLRVIKYGKDFADFDNTSAFRFLYTISKYVAYDVLKDEITDYNKKEIEHIIKTCADSMINSCANPEFLYMERTLVQEAIKKLPDNYSTILYLYYYHGYSFKEIGLFLGIKPNTVAQRCHYVRQKLKEILVKEGFHDERN
ncbi:MAG: sigma-70 family RNA polymerase sigma factor [Lachnospiraceae bacterium]|nr:sigma-70 family RNA polymerase sigma factor [Lachnospiraceae bacterium]